MFEIVGREEQVFEQWEQGVSLSNPCMKAGDEVVFRNASGATYVMIAGASGVEVPNRLLQMTCNILVDLEQGNEQHSDCQTVFEVNPADKPDDYVFIDNTIRKEAQVSGGAGEMVANVVPGANGFALDRGFSEIIEAVNANMDVRVLMPDAETGGYNVLRLITNSVTDIVFGAFVPVPGANFVMYMLITVHNDDTVTVWMGQASVTAMG